MRFTRGKKLIERTNKIMGRYCDRLLEGEEEYSNEYLTDFYFNQDENYVQIDEQEDKTKKGNG
jgi:hypothetical protein